MDLKTAPFSSTEQTDTAITTALTFDDVLLVPQHSTVPSRRMSTRLTRTIRLNVPILSAAMDTVTEFGLAMRWQLGGLGVIHKNLQIHDRRLVDLSSGREGDRPTRSRSRRPIASTKRST